MEIGKAIRAKRELKKVSARSLSASVNKSPTYISKVESGEISLSFEGFCQIAKALDFSTIEVLYLVANGGK